MDGINLLRIPSRDASAYGRALLDTLFTKAEQKAHVLFKTSKSNKPPLDRAQGKNIDNKINALLIIVNFLQNASIDTTKITMIM